MTTCPSLSLSWLFLQASFFLRLRRITMGSFFFNFFTLFFVYFGLKFNNNLSLSLTHLIFLCWFRFILPSSIFIRYFTIVFVMDDKISRCTCVCVCVFFLRFIEFVIATAAVKDLWKMLCFFFLNFYNSLSFT